MIPNINRMVAPFSAENLNWCLFDAQARTCCGVSCQ